MLAGSFTLTLGINDDSPDPPGCRYSKTSVLARLTCSDLRRTVVGTKCLPFVSDSVIGEQKSNGCVVGRRWVEQRLGVDARCEGLLVPRQCRATPVPTAIGPPLNQIKSLWRYFACLPPYNEVGPVQS